MVLVRKKKSFYGHACGVRVQRVQKVQRVQRGRLTGLRPEGCVEGLCSLPLMGQGERFLGLTGLMAGGFLSLTALRAEGYGLPLCGNAYKVSVTDLPFCVIRYDRHSADWLAALASPLPAAALDAPAA